MDLEGSCRNEFQIFCVVTNDIRQFSLQKTVNNRIWKLIRLVVSEKEPENTIQNSADDNLGDNPFIYHFKNEIGSKNLNLPIPIFHVLEL